MKLTALLLSPFFRKEGPCVIREIKRVMSSAPQAPLPDHSQRTANNYRQDLMSEATILSTAQLNPSVKSVVLCVHDRRLSFKAGQWVDVFIPGVEQVGGFSMVSPPSLLEKTGQLQLAIKYSSWPPAHWVHTCCKAGDRVNLRVGGDFYYEPPADSLMPDMIFIAGGVGINPLLSILQQISEFAQQKKERKKNLPKRITLLYSAKTEDGILFKERITSLKKTLGNSFDYQLFVTEQCRPDAELESASKRRISTEDVREILDQSDKDQLLCFLCGPPPMTDRFITTLQELGVPLENILFEKWW